MSIYSLSLARHRYAGLVSQSSEGDWKERAIQMARVVKEIAVQELGKGARRTRAVIETPDNWFTDRGEDSKRDEAVQKLYWFVGHLVGALEGLMYHAGYIQDIWTVVPKAWKGQTPKPIMHDRGVKALTDQGWILDPKKFKHDVAEAVLLARIAGNKLRSEFSGGKGWTRVWSSNGQEMPLLDGVHIRQWIPPRSNGSLTY